MDWKELNLGTNSNVGDGDNLKTAFDKVKTNFTFLKYYIIESFSNRGNGSVLLDLSTPNAISCKSLVAGNNVTITPETNTITISANDSMLSQDESPRLAGNLNTNGFEINNATITGYGPVKINGVVFSSDLNDTLITTTHSMHFVSSTDRLYFDSAVQANTITANRFDGPTTGLHSGSVIGNVSGNLTGNTTGTHFGNVVGNVSNIGNHNVRELSDISDIIPNTDDILKWDGVTYTPGPLILPNMSTTSRDLLSPITGMVIYNTTTNKFQGYDTNSWVDLS